MEGSRSRLEDMRLIASAMAREFATRSGVRAVWLIGSVARGRIWDGSDIDLQVMVDNIEDRIECRQINDEKVVSKFLTEDEISKSILEDEDDPVVCAVRDSIILYDPRGIMGRLKRAAGRASQRGKRKLPEMIERLEETWEAWQGCHKAAVAGDRPALALALPCLVRSLMGLLCALRGVRIPNYTTTEENLSQLSVVEAGMLRDCLGVTAIGLDERFARVTEMLTRVTERISRIHGKEIALLLEGREMTYGEIEAELGAGIPDELAEVLVESHLISVHKRPIEMSGTTFFEKVYSAV